MRFIAYDEYDPKDLDAIWVKYETLQAERKKSGLGSFTSEIGKTMSLYDADNEEQLLNLALIYVPEAKFKFEPALPLSKFREIYQKMKQ